MRNRHVYTAWENTKMIWNKKAMKSKCKKYGAATSLQNGGWMIDIQYLKWNKILTMKCWKKWVKVRVSNIFFKTANEWLIQDYRIESLHVMIGWYVDSIFQNRCIHGIFPLMTHTFVSPCSGLKTFWSLSSSLKEWQAEVTTDVIGFLESLAR